jgi:hypothetical protein
MRAPVAKIITQSTRFKHWPGRKALNRTPQPTELIPARNPENSPIALTRAYGRREDRLRDAKYC